MEAKKQWKQKSSGSRKAVDAEKQWKHEKLSSIFTESLLENFRRESRTEHRAGDESLFDFQFEIQRSTAPNRRIKSLHWKSNLSQN